MNLLLVPSLLVDEFVMNSPVYWQDDDRLCFLGMLTVFRASFPLCPPVDNSAVLVSRWLLVMTC